jgi:hypothetical protein
MVEELCLFMGNLLKEPHDKLKLVLRDHDGLAEVGLLALGLGAAGRGARPRGGDRALGTGTLASRLLVVLVEPLLVAFVHKVGEAAGQPVAGGLFDSGRAGDISGGVLPDIVRIQFLPVVCETSRVRCRNIDGGLLLCLLCDAMGRREDLLQMVLLECISQQSTDGTATIDG